MELGYKCTIVFIIFVISQLHMGESIECYVCKSENDPSCATEDPGPDFIKDCSTLKEGPKYEACRKIDNWVDFTMLKQKPIRRVIRQCAADVNVKNPCYYRAGFGGRANVCDCFEDKCNHASTIFSSVVTLALSLFAAIYMKFL